MEFLSAAVVQRGPRRFRKMSSGEVEAILMHLEAQGWLTRVDGAGRSDAKGKWRIRFDFELVWSP
ncbi:MAG: hypothetical protein ACRDQZ_00595 [Mycobacteriales bacterium]